MDHGTMLSDPVGKPFSQIVKFYFLKGKNKSFTIAFSEILL